MNYRIISVGILVIGFFICLILILRSKWLATRKNIDDYQEGRDKLTYRKPKEEKESWIGGIGIGNLIGGFVVILIGFSLLPMVSEQVNLVQNNTNITGVTDTLTGLVLIFFALIIVCSAVGMVFRGLRSGGIL
jgi:membrane protease YdiL (CAAX protease family)